MPISGHRIISLGLDIMFTLRLLLAVGFVLYLGGCQTTTITGSINGQPSQNRSAAMPVGQEVVPPFGYIGFCLRNPEECQSQASGLQNAAFETALAPPVHLSTDKWLELNHVNDYVNRTVRPVDDLALHNRAEWWSYPTANGGDCEDYALLKRKLLIERGWPANSLLLSVVKQWDGAGHAVLLAVTQQGEYVLDNQSWEVSLWADAPYTWIKRQSRHHPYVWVNLDADRQSQGSMRSAELPPKGMKDRQFPGSDKPAVVASASRKALPAKLRNSVGDTTKTKRVADVSAAIPLRLYRETSSGLGD